MSACCNSIENSYTCEEIKINCLLADEVYKSYKQERFGIKSCSKKYNEYNLWDLQQLLNYNLSNQLDLFSRNTYRNRLYLEKFLKEQNAKGNIADCYISHLNICNISDLIEKINSL